jgi:predicted outer membrane lipoprotein
MSRKREQQIIEGFLILGTLLVCAYGALCYSMSYELPKQSKFQQRIADSFPIVTMR